MGPKTAEEKTVIQADPRNREDAKKSQTGRRKNNLQAEFPKKI